VETGNGVPYIRRRFAFISYSLEEPVSEAIMERPVSDS
jgi:hypothetical protein